MLQRRSICAVTMSVMLLVALSANSVTGAAWQPPTTASGQAAAPAATGQQVGGTVTTYSLNTRSSTRRSTTRNAFRCR